MISWEVNFDGLPGLTHNYAGLSFGNLASAKHAQAVANPKAAALQSLDKMHALHQMGLHQGILPPHERPDTHVLRTFGFSGSDRSIIERAWKKHPALAKACYSAAAMWVANAATVSPSADTQDQRVHFTPANLSAMFHRSHEHATTSHLLQAIFSDSRYFQHHPALPAIAALGDEGAANHGRLCHAHGTKGIELFVYGRSAFDTGLAPTRYPARQTREACEAIAQHHQLAPDQQLIVQQNPAMIDAGVFHNDVISVTNEQVLFYYEDAFVNTPTIINTLDQALEGQLIPIEVKASMVSLSDVVESYLFNSQLVTLPNQRMALILPIESQENRTVHEAVESVLAGDNPIDTAHYFDLRQSMRNGGGPACLRLRVALNAEELDAVNPHCLLTPARYTTLCTWVEKHYRDRMCEDDLRDPDLLIECRTALDELSQLLQLGSIYPFQREASQS